MVNLRISLLKGKNRDKLTLINENLKEEDLIKICESPSLMERYKLEKGKDYLRYNDILNSIIRLDIKCLSLDDDNYPKLLKEIYDPPFILYIRGDFSVLSSELVSVVGTRKPSTGGYRGAFKLGMDLGRSGVNVVSGLALGIDGACHSGNILTGGKTVAVLGSGIDTIYPKEHKELAASILSSGGILISEYPPGDIIRKYNFPKRNRIVAGLSWNLVVIQAPKKSGSLITGDFALQDGRDVWVHSSGIGDSRFLGSDKYFKDGAKKLSSAYPLLKSLNRECEVIDFDYESYTDNQLLAMELKGEIIKYRGGYFQR